MFWSVLCLCYIVTSRFSIHIYYYYCYYRLFDDGVQCSCSVQTFRVVFLHSVVTMRLLWLQLHSLCVPAIQSRSSIITVMKKNHCIPLGWKNSSSSAKQRLLITNCLFENVMLLVCFLFPFSWSLYVKYKSRQKDIEPELGPGIKSHLFSIIVVQSVQSVSKFFFFLFFFLVFLLPFWFKTRKLFIFHFQCLGLMVTKVTKYKSILQFTTSPIPCHCQWLLFLIPLDISRLLSFNAAREINCEIQTFHSVCFPPLFFCMMFDVWFDAICLLDHRKHNRNDNAFDSLTRVDHQ